MRPSHASASNPLSRNPLFALAAAFASGVYLHLGLEIDLRMIVFGFVLVLAATLVNERLLTCFVLTAFVCAGTLVSGLEQLGNPKTSLSQLYDNGWINSADPVRFEGILDDHPRLAEGGVFLSITADQLTYKKELMPTSGNVRLFLARDSEASEQCLSALDLKAGNRVRVSARLKRENPYLNPGTIFTIDSLDRRGIDATATLKSCFLIEKIGNGVSFLSFAYEFRENLTTRIIDTHDRQTAGIVLASLLGNSRFLTRTSGDTFRENGTFHVLIISGLHITLIGGLVLLCVRRLTSNRRLQFGLANSFLWTYATVVGLQLPVFRAALMYSIFLLGYAAHRERNSVNSLGAACLVILVWRPEDLFNPSFQLTFLSIFAIIGFAFPLIEKIRITGAWMPTTNRPFPPFVSKPLRIVAEMLYWSELRWSAHLTKQNWNCSIEKSAAGRYFADTRTQLWARRFFEIGMVSISVQLFLLPLLIINFHRVGAASLFSNLFAGAAVVLQNLFSLIALAVSVINLEAARSFVSITSVVTNLSLFLQETLTRNILQPFRTPVYTGVLATVYPLYYLPLTGLLFCTASWNPFTLSSPGKAFSRIMYLSLIAAAVLAWTILWHPYSSPTPDGRLYVDFLDVGQGDSALVTFPDGRTLLIDGGGRRDFESGDSEKNDVAGIGERVVSEFLWEKGYSSIDFVLATHPDADHIKGLTDVIGNFDVSKAFAGGDFSGVEEFDRFKAAANQRGVPIRVISEGLVLTFGAVAVSVLNPPRGNTANPDNEDSVVLQIAFKGRSILFTGDIGESTERRLCDLEVPLTADVVKVAHHGSRTSSSERFVAKTNALYAVIPAGRRSPYGHPHEEVVDRWEKNGSKVFTVGERGTVTFSTDGSDLRIEHFMSPEKKKLR